MSNSPVLLDFDGPICSIRFNRPQALNAIDTSLARDFLLACREVAARPDVRVLVLSGEGRGFMAGGDIAQFRDAPETVCATLIEPMNEALQLLASLDAAVLGSLHGPVAGAGLSMALACDLTIGADNCRFSFAYLALAASCDLGASWSLPRLVGQRRAMEIALLGEPVDAAGALQLGLLNRVVPADQLADATRALAGRLAQNAPLAQGQLKKLLRQSFERDMGQQMEAEKQAFGRCIASTDFREAVSAFLEKRPAKFSGA